MLQSYVRDLALEVGVQRLRHHGNAIVSTFAGADQYLGALKVSASSGRPSTSRYLFQQLDVGHHRNARQDRGESVAVR